jgi:hypothetical protein
MIMIRSVVLSMVSPCGKLSGYHMLALPIGGELWFAVTWSMLSAIVEDAVNERLRFSAAHIHAQKRLDGKIRPAPNLG